MTSVSVTEIRNALRCPRLFALGRQRGQALGFPVGSSCLGMTFHRIVERFSQSVSDPPSYFQRLPAGCARDELEARLGQWLLGLLVRDLEADPTYASIPAEVDDLAEALRELARHLAGRMQRMPQAPASTLPQVVVAGERSVEAALDDSGLLVRGRIDALYGDSSGVREVIEYKLTDEANHELDRAQVALYRELLKRTDGLDVRPIVLRFTPMLRETALDQSSADALVEGVLKPLLGCMLEWIARPESAPPTQRRDLCAACPVAGDCVQTYRDRVPHRDEPPTGAPRPRAMVPGAAPAETLAVPEPELLEPDTEGLAEAERIRDWILAQVRKEGIQASCPHPPVVGPTLYLIEVTRPRGRVKQLDRIAEDVLHRLATELKVDATYDESSAHRHFVVRRSSPRQVHLAPLLAEKRDWLSARPGRYVVGQCPDGTVLCGDFADGGTPHLLVGGQAGSGKSTFLLCLIASLVQYHGPDRIRFTLLDPKRVTFQAPSFRAAVGAHLDGPIGYDIDDALPTLERLVDIMEDRYRLFAQASVRSIDEYNLQVGREEALERKILVIDEFGDLAIDKGIAKHFITIVQRLGSKARAAGIHLVLATQRPDRQTVPPAIKANLGGKVALKVASGTNSRIILDAGGAENLHGKGDLIADLGQGLVRAQAALAQNMS